MTKEYKIEWHLPQEYNPSALLRNLPSPISNKMIEIYNYSEFLTRFCDFTLEKEIENARERFTISNCQFTWQA